jgi:hypothetical protein
VALGTVISKQLLTGPVRDSSGEADSVRLKPEGEGMVAGTGAGTSPVFNAIIGRFLRAGLNRRGGTV